MVIGGDGAEPVSEPGEAGRVQATPLVKRIAKDLGVDIATVTGSGPGGRVTDADVRAAATSPVQDSGHVSEGRREPLRGVRRLVAEHMARAHREVAPVTGSRSDFRTSTSRRSCRRCSACAAALQEFPELNARLDGDAIVYLDRYDLGVAADGTGPRRSRRPRLRDEVARRVRERSNGSPKRHGRGRSSPRSYAARRSR